MQLCSSLSILWYGSKERHRALLLWLWFSWGALGCSDCRRDSLNTAGIPLPGIYPQDAKTAKRRTHAHSRNSPVREPADAGLAVSWHKASARTLPPGFSRDRRTTVGRAGAAQAGCRLDAAAAVRKPRSSVQSSWAAATARQPTHSADRPVSYPETCKD